MAVPSGELDQDKEQQEQLPFSEFIRACRKGDYEAVKDFLTEDPSLANIPDQDGETPLMYAIEAHSEGLSRLLLEHKGDVNAVIHSGSEKGITALWLAVKGLADKENDRSLVQILLEKGANDPDAGPKAEGHEHQGKTVFWYAVQHAARDDGDWTLAYFLLKKGVTKLDARPVAAGDPYYGMTPLSLASACVRKEEDLQAKWNFVRILLEKGVKDLDVSPPASDDGDDEEEGTNALWWAAYSSEWDVVRLLVEKGARGFGAVPIKGRRQGDPMLMQVVKERQWDLIRFFLKIDSRDLDAMSQSQANNDPGNRGLTLSWHAAHDKVWDVLSDLLNRGVKDLDVYPEGEEELYETMLWYTIKAQNDFLFRLLLTKGASLELTNNPKINLRALKEFLDDADRKEEGWSPLIITFNAAKVLFDLANQNDEDELEENEKQQCLERCLKMLGPALNGRVNGKTALQVAMETGNVPVAEALVLAGADLPLFDDEKMLTEGFDKLQIILQGELDRLLLLRSERRESKEEAESEALQKPVEARIKKVEEKIKKTSELKKLVQNFAKLQTLRAELGELASNTRESKEGTEGRELKEFFERSKKNLELASKLLKQGQTLEEPLHKDTFYYQLGELLHKGVEQRPRIPGAMVLEAFSKVSEENWDLYQKACSRKLHYSLVTPRKERGISNLEAPAEPISLDEEESGLDSTPSGEEAKEEVSRAVWALNASPPNNPIDAGLLYQTLMTAAYGKNISEMGGGFSGLSKEELRHPTVALDKALHSIRQKLAEAFIKRKESERFSDKESDFASSSSSSPLGGGASGEKVIRPEAEKMESTFKDSRSQKSEEIDQVSEGQPQRKTGQERLEQVKSAQPSLQSVEARSQLPAIDKAFAELFSERNFMNVSHWFSKGGDVVKALRDEPELQSCKGHIDALANLGQIEQVDFDTLLLRRDPRNISFKEQLKDFYKQQRGLYQNSLKDKEAKQASEVTSIPDSTQLAPIAASVLSQEPSAPKVDGSSLNTSVETTGDPRKHGKERWLNRLTLSILRQKQEGDTLKAGGSSGSSSLPISYAYVSNKKRTRNQPYPCSSKKIQRQSQH